jgi:hypothetical protein
MNKEYFVNEKLSKLLTNPQNFIKMVEIYSISSNLKRIGSKVIIKTKNRKIECIITNISSKNAGNFDRGLVKQLCDISGFDWESDWLERIYHRFGKGLNWTIEEIPKFPLLIITLIVLKNEVVHEY